MSNYARVHERPLPETSDPKGMEGADLPHDLPGIDSIPPEVRSQVLAMQQPAGWDGEDADPVSLEACRGALRFLAQARLQAPQLADPTSIAPTTSGAVSLYWDTGSKALVVEIVSEAAAKLYHQWMGPDGQRAEGYVDRDAVLSLAAGFQTGR
jgi:hypothetical protein